MSFQPPPIDFSAFPIHNTITVTSAGQFQRCLYIHVLDSQNTKKFVHHITTLDLDTLMFDRHNAIPPIYFDIATNSFDATLPDFLELLHASIQRFPGTILAVGHTTYQLLTVALRAYPLAPGVQCRYQAYTYRPYVTLFLCPTTSRVPTCRYPSADDLAVLCNIHDTSQTFPFMANSIFCFKNCIRQPLLVLLYPQLYLPVMVAFAPYQKRIEEHIAPLERRSKKKASATSPPARSPITAGVAIYTPTAPSPSLSTAPPARRQPHANTLTLHQNYPNPTQHPINQDMQTAATNFHQAVSSPANPSAQNPFHAAVLLTRVDDSVTQPCVENRVLHTALTSPNSCEQQQATGAPPPLQITPPSLPDNTIQPTNPSVIVLRSSPPALTPHQSTLYITPIADITTDADSTPMNLYNPFPTLSTTAPWSTSTSPYGLNLKYENQSPDQPIFAEEYVEIPIAQMQSQVVCELPILIESTKTMNQNKPLRGRPKRTIKRKAT